MTAPDHKNETAGDRASLARQAGLGELSFISVLAGVLVAYGSFAVLAALIGAAATAVGLTNDLSRNDWARRRRHHRHQPAQPWHPNLGQRMERHRSLAGIASLAAMLIGA